MTTIEEISGELWTKCETKIGLVSIKISPILVNCVKENELYQSFVYWCHIKDGSILRQGYTMTPGLPSFIANQITEIGQVFINNDIKLYSVNGGLRLN